MASEFKIPDLGENVTSGEVVRMLVNKGDTISKDQSVLEIETGKATIEVPSSVEGTITSISVKEGDQVEVGQLVLTVDSSGGSDKKEEKDKKDEKDKKEQKEEKEDKEEPKQQSKTKEEKDESESKSVEKSSAQKKEESSPPPSSPTLPVPPSDREGVDRIPVAAAPSVRKFAREIGVRVEAVPGSGDRGRITVDDVKAYAKQLLTQPGAPAMASGGGFRVPALPDFSKFGEIEREAMNNIRKMTAQHMALCWGTIPHVTQHDKADITDLERMRKRYAKKAESVGGKLTLTAMLLKIVASALKVYPQFNASLDLAREEMVLKKYYNIGVAVDTAKGLVVPVVRDVDQKNIMEIAIELTEIAEKARTGRISPADMQGGTFTISNLGGIGGNYFTPIVNHPEVAILGIGRGAYEPRYEDGEFVPRMMLPMSLSYDHRVIDGADGARFLRWIAEAIQEPLLVVMEG
jgi:pyruvate dehydrogenase E2 component (dihydrolipoamide acetyltransferase)